MKTKHTKGEWKATKETNGNFVMAGNYCIARTTDFSGTEETFANAKLIAAAPELLEACKLFIENGFQTPSNKDFNILVEVVKKATE